MSDSILIDTNNKCIKLNNQFNEPIYELIDINNPHKGLKISYKGGDYSQECQVSCLNSKKKKKTFWMTNPFFFFFFQLFFARGVLFFVFFID